MLRFLIKFLLLSIIVIVSIMLIAQWQLDEELKDYTRQLEPLVDLKYESAEISYTGEITLNSLVAHFQTGDINVEIGRVKLSVGNLLDLAMFKSNLAEKKIPEQGYLIVEDLLLPFNSKLVKSVEKVESSSSLQVISWAHCGSVKNLNIGTLESMGYDYIAADNSLFFMLDKYSGSAVINGKTDIEDALRFEYQINIGGVMAWLESQEQREVGEASQDKIVPEVSLLEIRAIDNGYNERKARMCADKQGVSLDEYYAGHVEEVGKIFKDVGIEPSESFSQLYPDSIKPKSEIYWFMQPKANFAFSGVTYYSYQELLELGGLRLLINKKPVDLFSEGWSYESFQQILANEEAKNQPKKKSIDLYETVSIKRDYRPFASTRASQFIGLKARIKRNDGQLYDGKISKANDQNVWLVSRSANGEITIPLKHSDIERFEVLVRIN